jgi:hypothetical protein
MYVNTGKGGTEQGLRANRLEKLVLTRDKIKMEGRGYRSEDGGNKEF